MNEKLYLGLDGGGTNCRARISNAKGDILGEGSAGSSNTRLGIDVVYREIVSATTVALQVAGLSDTPLNQIYAGLGLAGLSLKSDQEKLLAFPHPFAGVTANNDAYAACLGAHAGDDGGIFIFGTGSCGCAIVDGKDIYVGGWGFDISDVGSGAQAGLKALRSALLAHDAVIEATELSKELMQWFDNSPEKAVLWAADAKPADYGQFAPLISKHAALGDALALEIMTWSAEGAGQCIQALHKKGARTIALVGGFSDALEPWLGNDIRKILSSVRGDAMDGALLMARRAFPGD